MYQTEKVRPERYQYIYIYINLLLPFSPGATPLHAWARFQHSKQSLGDRLVQAGAHEAWRDFSGRTPRELLQGAPAVAAAAAVPSGLNDVAIQICSDLHIEFYDTPKPPEFLKPSAPYLVAEPVGLNFRSRFLKRILQALLGDIGVIAGPKYEQFLLEVADLYQTVFLVLVRGVTFNHSIP